jgi:hypothetical protein
MARKLTGHGEEKPKGSLLSPITNVAKRLVGRSG